MKLKTIKQGKNLLFFEVEGESIGFVNLIEDELWKDKNTDEAAHIKEHPYMAEPKIYVKMKGKSNPKLALGKSIKRLQMKLKNLERVFKRALRD